MDLSHEWRERYSADAGLPFDPDELEARLVWIWGSPRSGSTWLLRQLCSPALIDEDLPLGFAVPDAAPEPLAAVPFNEFLVSSHIAPRGPEAVEIDGTYFPQTPNLYLAHFNSYALADRFRPVWAPELRRLILVRVAAALDRAPDEAGPIDPVPLAVIKEVNGSHAADLVMSLFPRSRMIFLVRDGRDVVDSRIHAHGKGGWLVGRDGPRFRTDDERLEWVGKACREWACNMDIARSAYERHPDPLRHRVRYEDLRAEPERILGELLEWLGLPSDPGRVRRIVEENAFDRLPADERGPRKTFRAATPGLWRQNLTRDEQRVAEEIVGPRLAALGYDD